MALARKCVASVSASRMPIGESTWENETGAADDKDSKQVQVLEEILPCFPRFLAHSFLGRACDIDRCAGSPPQNTQIGRCHRNGASPTPRLAIPK